jgi:dihydrofolate synthase/folylpolyglutamate synthase
MSYQAAIDELNAMAPELFTRPGQPRRKFSLDEIGMLLGALGDPQRRLRSVLIAGTNGKGSTAATLASILTASGVRTGLYTSPHLARANERIRLDGVEIEDDAFASLYFRVHDTAQQLVLNGKLPQLPSFFEVLTAQALLTLPRPG